MARSAASWNFFCVKPGGDVDLHCKRVMFYRFFIGVPPFLPGVGREGALAAVRGESSGLSTSFANLTFISLVAID